MKNWVLGIVGIREMLRGGNCGRLGGRGDGEWCFLWRGEFGRGCLGIVFRREICSGMKSEFER